MSRNSIGTISGAANGAPVSITVDRDAWAISGSIDNAPIQATIDFATGRVTGLVNNAPVDLGFSWSPHRVIYTGNLNHQDVRIDINFDRETLRGVTGGAPLDVHFDLVQNSAQGVAGRQNFEIKYDPETGRYAGYMNRAELALRLENLEFRDFLRLIFLFLK